jgi:hypothetical protein
VGTDVGWTSRPRFWRGGSLGAFPVSPELPDVRIAYLTSQYPALSHAFIPLSDPALRERLVQEGWARVERKDDVTRSAASPLRLFCESAAEGNHD